MPVWRALSNNAHRRHRAAIGSLGGVPCELIEAQNLDDVGVMVMGKYANRTFEELREEWRGGKPGPKKSILKAIAKFGTRDAAEFIYDCAFRQHKARSAQSVIETLPLVGDEAAPFLVQLVIAVDGIPNGDADSYLEMLEELGGAGTRAARRALFELAVRYRGYVTFLDRQLAQVVEDKELRTRARAAVLERDDSALSVADSLALEHNTRLLERWAAHVVPDLRTWTLARSYQERWVRNLARAICRLTRLIPPNDEALIEALARAGVFEHPHAKNLEGRMRDASAAPYTSGVSQGDDPTNEPYVLRWSVVEDTLMLVLRGRPSDDEWERLVDELRATESLTKLIIWPHRTASLTGDQRAALHRCLATRTVDMAFMLEGLATDQIVSEVGVPGAGVLCIHPNFLVHVLCSMGIPEEQRARFLGSASRLIRG